MTESKEMLGWQVQPDYHERKVNAEGNSTCGSANLSDLDFNNWFTDTSFEQHYIHVAGPDKSWHRVYCNNLDARPRLRMIDGELYWLTRL